MHRRYRLVVTAAAFALAAGPALAEKSDEADATTLSAAKITLSAAIAEAEKHAQGKAVDAELEKKDGKAIYEVEVAANGKTVDVTVDAEKGGILTSKPEEADGEDKED